MEVSLGLTVENLNEVKKEVSDALSDIPVKIEGLGKQLGEFAKGVRTGAFGGEGGAGMGKLLGGLALVTGAIAILTNEIKKILSVLVKSSPMLQGILNIFDRAISIFFRPFGDFLAIFLKPMARELLKMAVSFNRAFGIGRPETREAARVGGEVFKGFALEGGIVGAIRALFEETPIDEFLAQFVIGTIMFPVWLAGFIADSISNFGTWLVQFITGVIEFSVWLVQFVTDSIGNFGTWLSQFVTDTIMNFNSWLSQFVNDTITSFGDWLAEFVLDPILDFGSWLGGFITDTIASFGTWLSEFILNPIFNFASWLAGFIINPIQDLGAWLAQFIFGGLPFFQAGGFVSQTGPAFLHRGETVIGQARTGNIMARKGGGTVNQTINFNIRSLDRNVDLESANRRARRASEIEFRRRGLI